MVVVSFGKYCNRILRFEIASAKTIHEKMRNFEEKNWLQLRTGRKANFNINLFLDIANVESIFSSLIWFIKNNELTSAWPSARFLAKCTGSSFVLHTTLLYKEMEYWPSYQQLLCPFTHETAAFYTLEVIVFVCFFRLLTTYTEMASSALCLPLYFNFWSIDTHQTHLDTEFYSLARAFEHLKHLFWFR